MNTFQDPGVAGGPDGGFGGFFVLALLVGVGMTVWKVSTARRMARQSGMSESDATAMTLLTDDGLEATYLASNLRPQASSPTGQPDPSPAPQASVSDRLRELDQLLEQGLVTRDEYDAARRAILGSL